MESERMDDIEALRTVATVQRRAASRQRPLDWIQLWWGVALGGYVALFSMLFAEDEPRTQVINAIALPPMIIAGALLEGARARTGIRRRERAGFYVVLGVTIALMLAVLGITMFGRPPAWWPAVAGTAVAALLVAQPAVRLLRTRGEASDWGTDRQPRIGAAATVVLAALFGACAVAGTVGGAFVAPVVLIVVIVIAVAGLVVNGSRWGLEAIGAGWARRQWIGFGLTILVLYTGALPVSALDPHPLVAAGYSLAVTAPLALSTLPWRRA